MIHNLIFDWSGVISDNIRNVYSVAMVIFKKYGAEPITLEEFRETWDQPYMVFYDKHLPAVSLADEAVLFRNEIMKRPPASAFPGVPEVLRKLRQSGKHMIVISGDIRETIFPEIERFGLAGVFSEVNYNIHDKVAVIEEIVARNRFQKSRTMFIGDTTHEVEAGRKAGMLAGVVTWGYKPEAQLRAAQPDMIFRTVGDLANLI